MSDNILEADDVLDQSADAIEAAADEVGLTSQEAEAQADQVDAADALDEKKSRLKSFSIFDGLLLISLICVSLATLFLFLELSKFGSLMDGFPWRTNEYLNQ